MNMQGNLGRNIPQTAPQGIAALQGMQRPQQPQQQGPQGLQNIPPDLMRALGVRAALEAEEKAKQQIAAMTQQALEQQIPQTSIAEQDFEKLKSEELAKMTRQIGDQRMAAEQKALRDVSQKMAGIPSIPGAGDGFARMAGGGIVAFQQGGEAPDFDPRPAGMEFQDLTEVPETQIDSADPEKLKRLLLGNDPRARALREYWARKEEEKRRKLEERESPRTWEKVPQEASQGAEPDLMGETLIKPGQVPPQGMRMPPAQVRSKVPAGVAGAVQQPVVRPDSTGQGISPPAPQQAAPSYTQDLMTGLSKYQTQEFENMSKLAKELYALPPEVRQIYEQRLAQAKQAARPAPQDFAGRFAKLGGYNPAKGIASAYNQMMSDERTQQEKLRAGVTSAEDALIRAQEAARLKSAETALGARGKAGEIFANVAGVGERARATDVSAKVQREQIASQEQVASMDREVRLKVANIQASAARGDDKAKLAVERLKAAMQDQRLQELAKQAAVNPKRAQEYNEYLEELIKRFAPEFANKPAASAAGQKVIDFASIGAK